MVLLLPGCMIRNLQLFGSEVTHCQVGSWLSREGRTICVASMRNASNALNETAVEMGVDLWLSTRSDETVSVKSVILSICANGKILFRK